MTDPNSGAVAPQGFHPDNSTAKNKPALPSRTAVRKIALHMLAAQTVAGGAKEE
jgi:hypothetical protein